jgi:hypothetical protein
MCGWDTYELEFGSARQLSREGARERSTQHSRAELSTAQHSTAQQSQIWISHNLLQFTALNTGEPIQTRLFCRRMVQLEQPNWAHLLGSPFALAVAPFLSNKELFELSASSRKVLRLRYDLGRWAVRLNDTYYESFRIKRHSVPSCFEGRASFDLVTYLGSRLRVSMFNANVENVDALAGVHTLSLHWCQGITDVSALAVCIR